MQPVITLPLSKAWTEAARTAAAAAKRMKPFSDEEKATARRAIEALPDRDRPGGNIHGKPMVSIRDMGLKWIKADESHPGFQGRRQRKFEDIPIDQISEMQTYVSREKVGQYIENQNHPLPRFVMSKGRYALDNGHHRVAAELLAGRKTVKGLVQYVPGI